ncbi:MAG TPA: MaoC family dehydratase N-terminal domain-containing protein [Polyangia bacterium]|nr:MaoC family dehydratase N-terminal domain-containing protein [Polyangia bacterium]
MDPSSRFAAFVGRESSPLTVDVERGHIRRFAQSIGDDNPIYQQLDGRVPAPPTFAAALRANDPREGMDIDWRKLLHGEQEFFFERPIYAGDRLTIVGRIADAQVKSGKAGDMDVLVLETLATDDTGARVFSARSVVLVRR